MFTPVTTSIYHNPRLEEDVPTIFVDRDGIHFRDILNWYVYDEPESRRNRKRLTTKIRQAARCTSPDQHLDIGKTARRRRGGGLLRSRRVEKEINLTCMDKALQKGRNRVVSCREKVADMGSQSQSHHATTTQTHGHCTSQVG